MVVLRRKAAILPAMSNRSITAGAVPRLAVALVGLGLVVSAGAAESRPAPPEKTGLAVGQKAPDFTLQDQTGAARSLADTLKQGAVAVVFYRSADW